MLLGFFNCDQQYLYKKYIILNVQMCLKQRPTVGGSIPVRLVSSFTGLDSTKQENMFVFIWTKSIESKPGKL